MCCYRGKQLKKMEVDKSLATQAIIGLLDLHFKVVRLAGIEPAAHGLGKRE